MKRDASRPKRRDLRPASGTRHFGFGGVHGVQETKLPCGGTKLTFVGSPMPGRSTEDKRMFQHPISDKRHFAGVKAATTRLINETVRRIKEARRTHFPAADYARNETYEQMFLDDVTIILEDVLR